MRNQLFDPGFLFDFYSDRGSTGTLSVLSNVSRSGQKISRKADKVPFLRFFSMFDHPLRKRSKPRETIFGSLVERWVMY